MSTRRKSTAETIAAAAKLAAPEHMWSLLASGSLYDTRAWKSGLDGSYYKPAVLGCDWLIGFCRETGVEPTVQLLKTIEKIIREERK